MSYNLFDPSSPAAAAAAAAVTSTHTHTHTHPCARHTHAKMYPARASVGKKTSYSICLFFSSSILLFSLSLYLLFCSLISFPPALTAYSLHPLVIFSLCVHPSCLSTNRVACLELSMVLKERERERGSVSEKGCVCVNPLLRA